MRVRVAVASLVVVIGCFGGALSAQQAASSSKVVLDFEFFETRVQPIFLEKRTGSTRCVVCHSGGGGNAFLEPLEGGATTWTQEQSRTNFKRASALVVPEQPLKSRLLLMPLERAAGGAEFHSGGRHFASQRDPNFLTLADWVNGERAQATRATR
jgi:hypothetical protein